MIEAIQEWSAELEQAATEIDLMPAIGTLRSNLGTDNRIFQHAPAALGRHI
jgi:hypothetical protein